MLKQICFITDHMIYLIIIRLSERFKVPGSFSSFLGHVARFAMLEAGMTPSGSSNLSVRVACKLEITSFFWLLEGSPTSPQRSTAFAFRNQGPSLKG